MKCLCVGEGAFFYVISPPFKKSIKILLQIVLHWLIFPLETNKHINEHAVNQIQ